MATSLLPFARGSLVKPVFCRLRYSAQHKFRATRPLCKSLPSPKRSSIFTSAFSTNTVVPLGERAKDHSIQVKTGENEEAVCLPEPPTTCCMSGCANCVWFAYGRELLAIYKDGGKAAQQVLEAVEDPGVRAFLSIELAEALKETNKYLDS